MTARRLTSTATDDRRTELFCVLQYCIQSTFQIPPRLNNCMLFPKENVQLSNPSLVHYLSNTKFKATEICTYCNFVLSIVHIIQTRNNKHQAMYLLEHNCVKFNKKEAANTTHHQPKMAAGLVAASYSLHRVAHLLPVSMERGST